MNEKEIRYMLRHITDPRMSNPSYVRCLACLAKIYASDKDLYNDTLSLIHSIDGSAYIPA